MAHAVIVEHRRCSSCHRWLPLDEFHRRSDAYDGRQGMCKLCNRDYQRMWKANRREH